MGNDSLRIHNNWFLLKKLISILICFSLLFNAGAYIFFYWQIHNMFRAQALQKTHNAYPESMLVKIIIPRGCQYAEDLFEENEIKYDGNYYDIVKKEYSKNNIILFCISDENEDKLEASFAGRIEHNSDDRSTVPVKTILKQIITEGLNRSVSETLFLERVIEYGIYIKDNYTSHYSEIPDPPPNIS